MAFDTINEDERASDGDRHADRAQVVERAEGPKPPPQRARVPRIHGESDEDRARRLRSLRNARYRRSVSQRKGSEK